MEFPRLVYKSASKHALAEDAEQFDAKIKEGWFASVPEALNPPKLNVDAAKPRSAKG